MRRKRPRTAKTAMTGKMTESISSPLVTTHYNDYQNDSENTTSYHNDDVLIGGLCDELPKFL
jgi:hypothetical protein